MVFCSPGRISSYPVNRISSQIPDIKKGRISGTTSQAILRSTLILTRIYLMTTLQVCSSSLMRILMSPVPLSFHSGGSHSWAYLIIQLITLTCILSTPVRRISSHYIFLTLCQLIISVNNLFRVFIYNLLQNRNCTSKYILLSLLKYFSSHI